MSEPVAETPEPPANTPAQEAYIRATEEAWEQEKTWPIYRVAISGDAVEWRPRNDERYWHLEDPNDPNSAWVPNSAENLPVDASLHPDTGGVVRTATAVVLCHAQSEDHAKMLALRDNPDYHTVDSVTLNDEPVAQ